MQTASAAGAAIRPTAAPAETAPAAPRFWKSTAAPLPPETSRQSHEESAAMAEVAVLAAPAAMAALARAAATLSRSPTGHRSTHRPSWAVPTPLAETAEV